jgi:hypothetical protein
MSAQYKADAVALNARANSSDRILDPFCGRGTTSFAARLLGLDSVSIDSNPVAVTIAQAKLISIEPTSIVACARGILNSTREAEQMPEGEFWSLAFHPDVLRQLCTLRESLLDKCDTSTRVALRALIMGALHGPLGKKKQSYFSNQCPRTYAPKPAYAAKFWKQQKLKPPAVNVLDVIADRAKRFYSHKLPANRAKVLLADSRETNTFKGWKKGANWVVTSPPYYGMRTYIPDQWLRGWFIGGPNTVDYSNDKQLQHSGAEEFSKELEKVWKNVQRVAAPGARMVIRFGGINDRKVDPLTILEKSLVTTRWEVTRVASAGLANDGKQQARTFLKENRNPIKEYDVYARLLS